MEEYVPNVREKVSKIITESNNVTNKLLALINPKYRMCYYLRQKRRINSLLCGASGKTNIFQKLIPFLCAQFILRCLWLERKLITPLYTNNKQLHLQTRFNHFLQGRISNWTNWTHCQLYKKISRMKMSITSQFDDNTILRHILLLWDDLRRFSRSSIRDEREHRRLKAEENKQQRRSPREEAGIDTFGPQSLSTTRVTKAWNTKAAGIGIGGSNSANENVALVARHLLAVRWKIHKERWGEKRSK